MRKSILNNLKKIEAYKTADTLNYEGFKAWIMSDRERIRQLCMTGSLVNTFYVSEGKILEQAVEVLSNIAKEDPSYLASCIVEGRNKGFMRTVNILGLAILSLYDVKKFQEVFNQVILTGNDLEDFLDLAHRIRGFGRGIKRAIIEWIKKNTNQFYAIKYRNQIKDAIRISRPKLEDWLYDWIMGKKEVSIPSYSQVHYYTKAVSSIKQGKWKEAIECIMKGRLDWMSLISYGNPPKEVWMALSTQMGTNALLKLLAKLDREEVFKDKEMVEFVKKRLTVENLQKAKVFPFRVYIAYENVTNLSIRRILAEVLEEYVEKYDWSKWNKGKFAICPDVSCSMTTPVKGSSVRPVIVASLFAGILYKGLDDVILLPWDEEVREELVRPKIDSVLSHIEAISKWNGGGTYMERPLEYLLKNNIKVDYFILITDSEEWGKGWLGYWKDYKKIVPSAKAILIRVDAYPTRPFSDEDTHKYDIFQIFGWNDNVIRWIEEVVLS